MKNVRGADAKAADSDNGQSSNTVIGVIVIVVAVVVALIAWLVVRKREHAEET